MILWIRQLLVRSRHGPYFHGKISSIGGVNHTRKCKAARISSFLYSLQAWGRQRCRCRYIPCSWRCPDGGAFAIVTATDIMENKSAPNRPSQANDSSWHVICNDEELLLARRSSSRVLLKEPYLEGLPSRTQLSVQLGRRRGFMFVVSQTITICTYSFCEFRDTVAQFRSCG